MLIHTKYTKVYDKLHLTIIFIGRRRTQQGIRCVSKLPDDFGQLCYSPSYTRVLVRAPFPSLPFDYPPIFQCIQYNSVLIAVISCEFLSEVPLQSDTDGNDELSIFATVPSDFLCPLTRQIFNTYREEALQHPQRRGDQDHHTFSEMLPVR